MRLQKYSISRLARDAGKAISTQAVRCDYGEAYQFLKVASKCFLKHKKNGNGSQRKTSIVVCNTILCKMRSPERIFNRP